MGKRSGLTAAACALCALLCLLFAACAKENSVPLQASETGYIVRLRESGGKPFAVADRDALAAMLADDAVLWYEPDAELLLFDAEDTGDWGSEADSCYYESYQWNLAVIGADAAFDRNAAGQGIRVGVLDSGVNPHPDFGARLLPGHNYIEGTKDPDDTSDSFGHGTKVAGLIAGAGVHGCIGAAPMAEIVPLKCTDGQSVKVSALCSAIYGAIDDYGCNVLNLSMGIQTDHPALAEAVAYAEEKNVVIIAGAGNGGGKTLYYPAAYETVIGVGAVDRGGVWYSSSNHNAGVFLTAPGVSVRTTDHRGGYAVASGCSFSVPQVSGAAAVLLSLDRSLTPQEIRELFRSCAADRDSTGWDEYYGYGILDLAACTEKLAETASEYTPPLPADGTAPGVSVESYVTENGLDAVRVTVPFTVKGRNYLLRLLDAAGELLYADQQAGGGVRIFEVPLETSSGLRLLLTSDAERFEPIEIPLTYDVPESGEEEAGCARDGSCPLRQFYDLDPYAWYHDGIHAVLEKGIMNGFEDASFRPGGTTSRAMLVTILWRMAGSPRIQYALRFADVPEGSWYADALRWAVSTKIVSGYSETGMTA